MVTVTELEAPLEDSAAVSVADKTPASGRQLGAQNEMETEEPGTEVVPTDTLPYKPSNEAGEKADRILRGESEARGRELEVCWFSNCFCWC